MSKASGKQEGLRPHALTVRSRLPRQSKAIIKAAADVGIPTSVDDDFEAIPPYLATIDRPIRAAPSFTATGCVGADRILSRTQPVAGLHRNPAFARHGQQSLSRGFAAIGMTESEPSRAR